MVRHRPAQGEDGRRRRAGPPPRLQRVDWALGHAATYGRFADGDIASILAAHPVGQHRAADDAHSLQGGTRAWDGFGAST